MGSDSFVDLGADIPDGAGCADDSLDGAAEPQEWYESSLGAGLEFDDCGTVPSLPAIESRELAECGSS